MSLDEKVDKLAADFSEHRGETRQFNTNIMNYLGAVNVKLNGHLDSHEEELKAKIKEDKTDKKDWWNMVLTVGMFMLTAAEVFRLYKGH